MLAAPRNGWFEGVQGATLPGTLAFELPLGTLSAATAIELHVKASTAAGAPLLLLELGAGIEIGSDTTADFTLTAAQTAALPAQRLHYSVWIELETGERYETEAGILQIWRSTGSPEPV